MIHISNAGPHRIEGLEWAHERAAWEHLDVDASPGRGPDSLCQASRTRVKPWRPCGPIGHHLQLSQPLSNRGCETVATDPAPIKTSRRLRVVALLVGFRLPILSSRTIAACPPGLGESSGL